MDGEGGADMDGTWHITKIRAITNKISPAAATATYTTINVLAPEVKVNRVIDKGQIYELMYSMHYM